MTALPVPQPSPNGAARVVLLESNAAAREHLASLLGGQGYRVDAVGLLAAAAPHLESDISSAVLVANLLLDDGTALDLARRWTDQGRPALGISDVYFGPTARQLLVEQVGLSEVLEAPVDETRLLERVAALLPRPAVAAAEEAEEDSTAETALETVFPPALDIGQIALDGDLQETDIAAILSRLALDRSNGALMLQSDRIKKLVYLEDGIPVGIKSNLLSECLGQMLVQEGRLSSQACDESLDEMRRSGRQQGQVLVAMGEIAPEELEAAMQRQFLFKLQQLFSWTNGAYRYRDAAIPAAYQAPPAGTAVDLMWRAIRQSRPVERVRALLGAFLDAPVSLSSAAHDLSSLPLSESDRALFDRLDGTRTVRQVIDELGGREEPWLALYALTALGAVSYLAP